VIIKGDNALGKTNIIEGIQLLTMLSSFRNPNWEEVILKGESNSHLGIYFSLDSRELEISLEITDNKRVYSLNNKRKQGSTIQGLLPAVLFTPDDLNIIKGPMEARRNNIDGLGTQLSRTYSTIKQDYQKVVRQRNMLLRERVDDKLIKESWDQSLAQLGALLFIHRVKLYKRLIDHTQEVYSRLSTQERLTTTYIPSFKGRAWEDHQEDLDKLNKEDVETLITTRIKEVATEELARGKSLIGPHRDEIRFFIDGSDARVFGSQGQQRTIALALKIAEVEVIRQITQSEPVLLLDDVMSELDEKRRAALLDTIKPDSYTFITTTNLGYFNEKILEKAQVLTLLKKGGTDAKE
jgi:DNA replication and repair protein RecF